LQCEKTKLGKERGKFHSAEGQIERNQPDLVSNQTFRSICGLIPNLFKDLRSCNAEDKIGERKFHSAEDQIERNQPDLV